MSSNEFFSKNVVLDKKKRKKKLLILIPSILLFGSLTVISMFYFDVEYPVLENAEDRITKMNDSLKPLPDKMIVSANDSIPINQNDFDTQVDTIISSAKIDIYSLKDIKSDYLVIIGAFKDKVNAIHMRDQLIQDSNPNCTVVYNDRSLYWVNLGFYDSMDQASNALSNYNLDGWIKKI
jgi:hypothetical protein